MCFVVRQMDTEIYRADIELPVEIMQRALRLRNSTRNIFIALFVNKKPSTSAEIATLVGHARAYVNMRLQQLVDQDEVTVIQKGKIKYFEVKK